MFHFVLFEILLNNICEEDVNRRIPVSLNSLNLARWTGNVFNGDHSPTFHIISSTHGSIWRHRSGREMIINKKKSVNIKNIFLFRSVKHFVSLAQMYPMFQFFYSYFSKIHISNGRNNNFVRFNRKYNIYVLFSTFHISLKSCSFFLRHKNIIETFVETLCMEHSSIYIVVNTA